MDDRGSVLDPEGTADENLLPNYGGIVEGDNATDAMYISLRPHSGCRTFESVRKSRLTFTILKGLRLRRRCFLPCRNDL